MEGCTTPIANNYNPNADVEDYSCIYLLKNGENCHLFRDLVPGEIEDHSFTLSYSIAGSFWVFFHDYMADYYVHTREKLYSLKDNIHFKHNAGPAGQYYNTLPKPFFIDVVFAAESDMLLESVTWITEYLNERSAESSFKTLTHISIWNSTQHTGRIPLTQIWEGLIYNNIRRTKGSWSLNDFRDVLATGADNFLLTIFENYALNGTKVEPNPVWYEQLPIQDKWFCIRFEFDNTVDQKLILHDTTIQVLKQDR